MATSPAARPAGPCSRHICNPRRQERYDKQQTEIMSRVIGVFRKTLPACWIGVNARQAWPACNSQVGDAL